MSWTFIAGGLCGCLLTTLASYYFTMRFKRVFSRRAPVQTCTRAYFPRKYASYRDPHTAYVRHVSLSPTLSDFSEQERTNLLFLRHWIASGKVTEEI